MTEQATSFRLWYNRWAPVIMGVCLIIGATAAVVGALGLVRTSATQVEQARLLACFDRYAAVDSTSSKVIRAASVAKDDATSAFFTSLGIEGRAFKRLTHRILTSDADAADVRQLDRALALRAQAQARLERAQDALDQAREDNPIPDPPSEFCGSDADTEDPTDQGGTTE